MRTENQCLTGALAAFPYEGKIVAIEPFGAGHVNDTYAVYVDCYPRPKLAYVLQRLNIRAFPRPQQVMENIRCVMQFIHEDMREKGRDVERSMLRFLKTQSGDLAFLDSQGMPWRSYRFVEHSFCHDKVPTAELMCESGRAFGSFLRALDGYPVADLHETIPDFHNTPKRLEDLVTAWKEDPLGRAKECKQELDFALSRSRDCGILLDLQKKGGLPLRVTHNDTKHSKILFDERTRAALCVMDLDTTMPGLAPYDFGDSIRFGASAVAEDEVQLERVRLSVPLFEAYTKGYMEQAGGCLTRLETEMLPQGARLMTLECGIRFLTDHLLGDGYFRTKRPGQNMDRCRTQFKLVKEIEYRYDTLCEIVEKYAS